MFIPNTTGYLSRKVSTNLQGEPTFTAATEVACGVVHLLSQNMKTSVRTDSSASRGNAEEKTAAAKILFPAYVEITNGDRFEILGVKLEASGVEPRISVLGVLDHYEVDFKVSTP